MRCFLAYQTANQLRNTSSPMGLSTLVSTILCFLISFVSDFKSISYTSEHWLPSDSDGKYCLAAKLTRPSLQSVRTPRSADNTRMSESSSAPDGTNEHLALRKQIEKSFAEISQVIHTSRKPLPTQTGDGSYIEPPVPTGLFKDLQNMRFKDVPTLIQSIKSRMSGKPTDDKTYLMEKVIQVILHRNKPLQYCVEVANPAMLIAG